MLEIEMARIKLAYVARLFSGAVPPLEDKKDNKDIPEINDFGALLHKYTHIPQELIRYRITQLKNAELPWRPQEMYEPTLSQINEKIFAFYREDSKHWVDKTMEFVLEERKKANLRDQRIEEEGMDNTGILSEFTAGQLVFDFNKDPNGFLAESGLNINPEDECANIHLDPLYKKALKGEDTSIFFTKSLQELAVKIVTKYPGVKAVTGFSWIMDTPVAKRWGFNVVYREKYSDSAGFWGQFVNSNGQIDQDRARMFLETGKAPFSPALGVILVANFLERYLPKEYRGKIILKETIFPEYEEYRRDMKTFEGLTEKWQSLTAEEIREILSTCSFLKKFRETVPGYGLFNYFLQLKKKKFPIEQIKDDPRMNTYREAFKKYADSLRKFVDKEVVIE